MVKNLRGFTLVEVLAVMAIFLLLLAGVYSFFISGQKLFLSGSRQTDLHGSVRLAAERVIRELRYAHFLTLIGEDDWDPDSADLISYSYIYYDRDTKNLILLNQEGRTPLSDGNITDASFSAKASTLLFSLTGERGPITYTLDSSARLLNYTGNIDANMPASTPVAFLYSLNPVDDENAEEP